MFYFRYITFLFALAGYIQRRIHRRLHDAIQGLADEVPRNAQNPWVLHMVTHIYIYVNISYIYYIYVNISFIYMVKYYIYIHVNNIYIYLGILFILYILYICIYYIYVYIICIYIYYIYIFFKYII